MNKYIFVLMMSLSLSLSYGMDKQEADQKKYDMYIRHLDDIKRDFIAADDKGDKDKVIALQEENRKVRAMNVDEWYAEHFEKKPSYMSTFCNIQ